MPSLKACKLAVLSAISRSGVSERLLASEWRRRRLLLLGYHGFSQIDEHEWNSDVYLPPGSFRQRLSLLRETRCNVLPLAEALQKLRAGTLPPASIVLTIDDGTVDAYRLAVPVLKEFGYPATFYISTYYSDFQRPVFDLMCRYVLWKAKGKTITLPGINDSPILLDTAGQDEATRTIQTHARKNDLSGREKDELLAKIALSLDVDYEDLCGKRLFHLMNAAEISELAKAGFDAQLHTHCHRLYRDPERMRREIVENETRIARASGTKPRHFCYPSGGYMRELEAVLTQCGIESAVSCRPGLATRGSRPLSLPRLMDNGSLTKTEFAAWVSGEAALMPRRPSSIPEGLILD